MVSKWCGALLHRSQKVVGRRAFLCTGLVVVLNRPVKGRSTNFVESDYYHECIFYFDEKPVQDILKKTKQIETQSNCYFYMISFTPLKIL